MSSLPDVSYIDIHVPNVKTEREFLRLAVHAAAKKYRDLHTQVNSPQATCEEASSL